MAIISSCKKCLEFYHYRVFFAHIVIKLKAFSAFNFTD